MANDLLFRNHEPLFVAKIIDSFQGLRLACHIYYVQQVSQLFLYIRYGTVEAYYSTPRETSLDAYGKFWIASYQQSFSILSIFSSPLLPPKNYFRTDLILYTTAKTLVGVMCHLMKRNLEPSF